MPGEDMGPSRPFCVVINADGASRGNPGPAGIGVVISDEAGNILSEVSEPLGIATNNVAEYRALIRGLGEALSLGAEAVRIRMDSELVIRQVTGDYRVKSENLRGLYGEAKALLARFREARIMHVPREENRRADELANCALNFSSVL